MRRPISRSTEVNWSPVKNRTRAQKGTTVGMFRRPGEMETEAAFCRALTGQGVESVVQRLDLSDDKGELLTHFEARELRRD